MKRTRTLLALLCLSLLLSLQAAAFADPAATVAEKVAALCAECRAQGFTSEYDIAVWLHDWLTANADYDETLQQHEPEGVLLEGTGVCESYALAYQLLLNEMGLENFTLSGRAGPQRESHIWNVVRLDGVWCQIDVTFDDPRGGGAENHNYFGLTDTLMARDHFWDAADETQTCDSLANYYPQRMGALVYSTAAELDALLSAAATAQLETLELVYVGSEAEHEVIDDFVAWYDANANVYGIHGFEASFTSYGCTLSLSYGEPWEHTEAHLENPIDAPDFTLSGPEGSFTRDMYSGNGLVVLFLQAGTNTTASLLNSLSSQLDALREVGVEVLVCLDDAGTLSDCLQANSTWPGLRYCYWQPSALEAFCGTLRPGTTGYFWPFFAVINGESQIVYAADAYNFNATALLYEAFAVGNANPLPEPAAPERPAQNVENGSLSSVRNSEIKTALTEACANSSGVFFVMDYSLSVGRSKTLLDEWEADYALYQRAGFSVMASLLNISADEMAAYPHVSFLPFDSNVWGEMAFAGGYGGGYDIDYCNCYYLDSEGNILNYVNGAVLSVRSFFNTWVKALSYEASLPVGLTTLEGYAFADTALRTLDLTTAPLRAIPANAFSGCASLEFVKIPASVTDIDPDAFADCPNVVIVSPFNSAAAAYAWANGLPLLCP